MARIAVLVFLVYVIGAAVMSVVAPDVLDGTVSEVRQTTNSVITEGCYVVRRAKKLLSQPHQTVERFEDLLRELRRHRDLHKSHGQRLAPQRSKTTGQSSGSVPLQSS